MIVPERRVEQGNLIVVGERAAAAPEGDYEDPTALLLGSWGRNQHARGRVYSRNQTDEYFQEVELRLRSSLQPGHCTGYEVFWRCLRSDAGYAEIARWNGAVGDFTSLVKHVGAEYGVADGDLVEATIEGTVIRGFVNGVEVISAEDAMFQSGSPGIGFNFGVGDTNIDHGFTAFEVDTFDD
jgi:hypothetical protein